MAEDRDDDVKPLSSEELKRDEWREGGTSLKPQDAPGHTLPESESGPGGGDGDRTDGPEPMGGTMLPPD